MNDEKKTREQLLNEVEELRSEVERLESMVGTRQFLGKDLPLDVLERKVTEHMGWF